MKKKKKSWMYISIIFTIVGLGLWIFSTIGVGDHLIEGGAMSLTLDEPSSRQVDNIVITSLDPEDLDQAQETTGSPNGITIGHNPANGYGYWAMQLGYNDREPLTGFQVMVSEHGNPTEPLYIGLMGAQVNPTDWGNWIHYGYLNPGVLPQKDTYYWVGFDFSDNPINIVAGQQWYITLVSMDPTTGDNHWAWGVNPDNPYSRCKICTWDGTLWKSLAGGTYDGCFRTYTIEGPQEPPGITITANYQIISQFFGSLSLLGAVISGTKYFMVI